MKVRNKFSGEDYIAVPDTSSRDLEEILGKSLSASRAMAEFPAGKRRDSLHAVSGALSKGSPELSRIISIESGKPLKDSRKEVEMAALMFSMAADEVMPGHPGNRYPHSGGEDGKLFLVDRVPIGTVLSITPYGNPLLSVAAHAAPALAAGNSLISKPSSSAPASSIRLGDILGASGLPEHIMQNVVARGDGPVVRHLAGDSRIGMLAFSGRYETAGKLSEGSGLRKIRARTGSNSPVIVWDDADLDLAAEAIAGSAFRSQGQCMNRPQRIIIRNESYEYVRNRLIELTSRMKIGDPLEEETDIGPMISEEKAIRLEQLVNEARANGADVPIGGAREGVFYSPTIIENLPAGSEIWNREVYGPISCLVQASSFNEALELANDTEYGSSASVFTTDLNLALSATGRLDFGTIHINDVPDTYSALLANAVRGRSGTGAAGMRSAMEDMSEQKITIIRR